MCVKDTLVYFERPWDKKKSRNSEYAEAGIPSKPGAEFLLGLSGATFTRSGEGDLTKTFTIRGMFPLEKHCDR